MTVLTEEMILAKTRCKDIERVRNLNMFGSELENVGMLKKMPNLEVLSLSANKIISLQSFSHCAKLQELYLRKNAVQLPHQSSVADLHEVHSLRGLKYLHTLWLEENPCTSAKDYRKFVIYMLPRLCKLDGVEISTEEREQAEAYFAERPSVPGLNLNGGAVKYSLKPPTNPTNRMPSPRSVVRDASQQVSPLPNKGFDSPRIIISESPRGPTTGGSRQPSPYTSPRQVPALTGETNNHVLVAILSLVKELNLDGLMMLKTDVDARMRAGISYAGAPSCPGHVYTPSRGGEV